MLQNFYNKLDKDIMEECNVYKEKWFNIGISKGIYARCCCRDNNRVKDKPELFSKENFMDLVAAYQNICQL